MRNLTRIALLGAITAMLLTSARVSRAQQKIDSSDRVECICEAVIDRLNEATDRHFHKGEYCHNVNLTRMVVSAWPNLMDGYANAGWLLWSMDRDDEAIALFKQGIEANPKSYYMYDELGMYYFNRKKDYPTSISYYEQAIACADCKPMTYHILARAYEKNGQLDKAMDTWKRADKMALNQTVKSNMVRVQKLIDASAAPK